MEEGCGKILSEEKEITICCGDFGNLCEECENKERKNGKK